MEKKEWPNPKTWETKPQEERETWKSSKEKKVVKYEIPVTYKIWSLILIRIGGAKSLPQWQKIRFITIWGTWTYISLWDLMKCIPESCGNWLMQLPSYSPSYLKRETLHPFFKKVERSTLELLTCQPNHYAWEDHGTDPPASYAKAHEGQRGESRQPSYLHRGQVLPDQPSGLLR